MNISIFSNNNLFKATTNLFAQLGIQLNSNTEQAFEAKAILNDFYKDREPFTNVTQVYFAGIINNTIFDSSQRLDYSLEEAKQQANNNYEGLMLFALELSKQPTRSEISELTRAFNRISQKMPVALLLHYETYISIALSERFLFKQEWRQGEKVGKIIILRDINTESPHAGHLRILQDLAEHNAINYNQLHEVWLKVLDVNVLNKKFYDELSNWYFWAMDKVQFPDDKEKDHEIRNATNLIRLITRIIFIWFIKEKGLVPEKLFNASLMKTILKNFNSDESSHNYYNAIMQNLFFGTLNQKIEERNFITEKRFKGKHLQYNITALFRYPDLFNISKDEVVALFRDTPFLNGGLFDCLDKPSEQDNSRIIRIDGFSTTEHNRAIVPDEIFFGTEQKIDLNQVYDTKGKTYKTKGLINILNSYKFTVTENTPHEEDVALDPELLGKVFENLLASYNPETKTTARKQTGSFYTPREIVNYMVDESLKAHIKSITNYELQITDGELLLDDAMTDELKNQIISALNNIRILDPACGSGAFPMGILHRMVNILQKLDPDNKQWRKLQEEKALEKTRDAFKIENYQERENRLIEINDIFENNASDYGRKLFLIENCIFGIDIQPIAVQIAKLRFFISLIIDQKTDEKKDNFGIRALPNLETKFVAANTLIGLEKPKVMMNSVFENEIILEINDLKKELQEVRHNYFSANNRANKLKLQAKDKDLRKEITKRLEKIGHSSGNSHKISTFDLFDQNAHAEWFDAEWMFGVKDGFDVVIGNPPYLKEGRVSKAVFEQYNNSPYYQGKMDLWYMFACKGIDFLNNDGLLCYIATNNWVTSAGAIKLRNKIILETQIKQLVDFGNFMIFESASIQTMVILFSKNSVIDNYHFDFRKLAGNTILTDAKDLLNKRHNNKAIYFSPIIIRENFIDMFLTFSQDESILDKIAGKRFFLTEKEVAQGIVFPQDFLNKRNQKALENESIVGEGIFALSSLEKNKLHLSEDELKLIKPYYTTEQIVRYYSYPANKLWLIYTDSSFKNPNSLDNYPNLKSHLDKFATVLTSDNKPYGLHRAREERFFKGEKIVVQRKCVGQPSFSFSDFDCYVSATFYVIKTNRFNLKYLVGLLNSKLIAFWLKNKGKMQGNNFQLDKEPLLQVPIFVPNTEQQQLIIDLVNEILSAKQANPSTDTSELEREIDLLIYGLYGLTEGEIKIVEQNNKK